MPTALAIAAHPDDIEFCMAGTLLQLAGRGWEIHYCNLSSGNLGSATIPGARLATIRRRESQAAARALGAVWHPPIARDLEIFYNDDLLRRVASLVRRVQPQVILTHSPQDYMEDHMNTSRLAVTAAFARGMPNYRTQPPAKHQGGNVTVYHALPHGLHDGLGTRIEAGFYVDTAEVHARKRAALACHTSQKEWLDHSQGMDSYLVAMDTFSAEVGSLSRRFVHAEGWRRHSHLGFCGTTEDPIREVLDPVGAVLSHRTATPQKQSPARRAPKRSATRA
jgi:LmbE family N-acetylglucosaminyl deacetylase